MNSEYYRALLSCLRIEIAKKNPIRSRKSTLSPIYRTVSTGFSQILKNNPPGKRFGSNEDVIAETEFYFKAKYKSLYQQACENVAGLIVLA